MVLGYLRLILILAPWQSRPWHHLTRRDGADPDTSIRPYSKDVGPASALPVGAGPPCLPPYQLVCVCVLGCCRGASEASAANAWPVASSASGWRFPAAAAPSASTSHVHGGDVLRDYPIASSTAVTPVYPQRERPTPPGRPVVAAATSPRGRPRERVRSGGAPLSLPSPPLHLQGHTPAAVRAGR